MVSELGFELRPDAKTMVNTHVGRWWFFFFYCWVLSGSTPRDTMGWAEFQAVLFLLTFHTQVLKPFLILSPHPFLPQYSHSWQGKLLTILRIFLCCRVEEGEESNVVSEQRGNPSFDEISCVATLELGFPRSEVRVACRC